MSRPDPNWTPTDHRAPANNRSWVPTAIRGRTEARPLHSWHAWSDVPRGSCMSRTLLLNDQRIRRGHIWNIPYLMGRFSFGSSVAPWNQSPTASDENWLDTFVYEGYLAHGRDFLRQIHGRFAIAVYDEMRRILFLARDWIGEVPLHLLATPSSIHVANTISDIRRHAGKEYRYAHVRAFPHAHAQEIDLSRIDPGCVSVMMRPEQPRLYLDFEHYVANVTEEASVHTPEAGLELLRSYLAESILSRASAHSSRGLGVLLSGGLDSFSVALLMRSLDIPYEAYTLAVDQGSEDAVMAGEFAKRLGIKHHLVKVESSELEPTFEAAIITSECYHLFNVYCAVGMVLLGKALSGRDVTSAFCGEGVNEAYGDYKDWTVTDPKTNRPCVLQRVDHKRLSRTSERLAYVWGHAADRGKFNRQLGSGLAKHATSRMVKPFLRWGVTLECPYYDVRLLARMVAIPRDVIMKLGGKPGIMTHVLRNDLARFGIEEKFLLECKKVRLQDASEGGEGGITATLLKAGCDQLRAIEIFNHHFDADLDPVRDGKRLAYASIGA